MKTKVSKKYLDRNGRWVLTTEDVIEIPEKDENFILLMDELVEYYTRLTYAGYYNWNDQYGWETFTEALNRRSNKEAGYGR